MKAKVLLVLALVLLSLAPVCGENAVPSVEVKEEPYFIGMGFGFGDKDPYVVLELKIFRFAETNLTTGATPKAFRAVLTFKDLEFPVKIIKPDLKEFRADVMDTKPTKPNSPVVPIGHITLKVEKPDNKHDVAVGKLMIKVEEAEVSGQFNVFLNSLKLPKKEGKDTEIKGGNGN